MCEYAAKSPKYPTLIPLKKKAPAQHKDELPQFNTIRPDNKLGTENSNFDGAKSDRLIRVGGNKKKAKSVSEISVVITSESLHCVNNLLAGVLRCRRQVFASIIHTCSLLRNDFVANLGKMWRY